MFSAGVGVVDTSIERSSQVLQHGKLKGEFHKIEVSKARKYSSMSHDTALPEFIYRGSVAVHLRCSLSTMEATSLPATAQ